MRVEGHVIDWEVRTVKHGEAAKRCRVIDTDPKFECASSLRIPSMPLHWLESASYGKLVGMLVAINSRRSAARRERPIAEHKSRGEGGHDFLHAIKARRVIASRAFRARTMTRAVRPHRHRWRRGQLPTTRCLAPMIRASAPRHPPPTRPGASTPQIERAAAIAARPSVPPAGLDALR
jgi:hypothetical protein